MALHLLLSLAAQRVMFSSWTCLSNLPFKPACPLHGLPIIHAAPFDLQQSPVVFASVLSPVSYVQAVVYLSLSDLSSGAHNLMDFAMHANTSH